MQTPPPTIEMVNEGAEKSSGDPNQGHKVLPPLKGRNGRDPPAGSSLGGVIRSCQRRQAAAVNAPTSL